MKNILAKKINLGNSILFMYQNKFVYTKSIFSHLKKNYLILSNNSIEILAKKYNEIK